MKRTNICKKLHYLRSFTKKRNLVYFFSLMTKSGEHSVQFMHGMRDGIPICLGYISVAFAFGIFSVNQGLSPLQTVLISLVNVTSAGQLAGVPIITGGLPFIEMALSQLIINARYALMSISLSQKLDKSVSLADRLLISFVNTDEVFAVASGQPGLVSRWYLFGLIVTPYFGWATGTALGAAAGNILPEIINNALGIAIYGMFIAIVVPPSKTKRNVAGASLTACLLSIAFSVVPGLKNVTGGFVIIICAVITSTIWAIISPVHDEAGEETKKNEETAAAEEK